MGNLDVELLRALAGLQEGITDEADYLCILRFVSDALEIGDDELEQEVHKAANEPGFWSWEDEE